MILRLCILAAAGLSLAACSASGGGGTGGGGGRVSEIATSQQVLNKYNRTFANSGTTLTQETTKGIQGFAAVTQTYNNGQQDNGFAKTNVRVTGNTAQITTNGLTTTANQTSSRVEYVNGRPVQYREYRDGSNRSIATITGAYSSLANVANYENGSPAGQNTYSVTGLETPANGLPRQQAIYDGQWQATSPSSKARAGGGMTLEADFARNRVDWATTGGGSNRVGTGTGVITGNRFTGNGEINLGNATGRGEFVGGFYGPVAEEVGGVMSGTVSNGGRSDNVVGGFIGNQR